MKPKFNLLLILSLCLSLSSYGQTKISVKEDAYVAGGEDASKNFGEIDKLLIKNAEGDNKYNRKALLKFELNKSTKIENATLHVNGRAFENEKRPNELIEIAVNIVEPKWNENTVKGENEPKVIATIGNFVLNQGKKTTWYAITLDASQIEKLRKKGVLALSLTQSGAKNSLIGYISSKEEKAWKTGELLNNQAYIEINK